MDLNEYLEYLQLPQIELGMSYHNDKATTTILALDKVLEQGKRMGWSEEDEVEALKKFWEIKVASSKRKGDVVIR